MRFINILAAMSLAAASSAVQAQEGLLPDVKAFLAKPGAPMLNGLVHVEGVGDMPLKSGEWAGIKGRGRTLEDIVLTILDTPADILRIEYECHLEGVGDIGWFTEGSLCGGRGHPRRLEAIRVRLAGIAARFFRVRYECFVEGVGDQGLKTDEHWCGIRGLPRRLDAVRIWLERR